MTSRQLNRKYKNSSITVEYIGTTTHNCERGVRVWIINDLITGYSENLYYNLSDAESTINNLISLR